MNEEEQSQEIRLPLEWHVPDSIQNRYVHNLIVQPGKYELTLFFFETKVPPFLGSPEEVKDFLTKQGTIRSECVSKLTVSPQLVPEIIKALQTGLESYNRLNALEERKDE
ncbi:MAG TPA: hypothetical protein VKV20_06510 [Ktedonobacteraceae bacterium]|jgi:hypothetical protein|nr:hypothetical protein [Ktedonobacteraceae bacterium]